MPAAPSRRLHRQRTSTRLSKPRTNPGAEPGLAVLRQDLGTESGDFASSRRILPRPWEERKEPIGPAAHPFRRPRRGPSRIALSQLFLRRLAPSRNRPLHLAESLSGLRSVPLRSSLGLPYFLLYAM